MLSMVRRYLTWDNIVSFVRDTFVMYCNILMLLLFLPIFAFLIMLDLLFGYPV